jgi:hypothetical protein
MTDYRSEASLREWVAILRGHLLPFGCLARICASFKPSTTTGHALAMGSIIFWTVLSEMTLGAIIPRCG